MRRLMTLVLFFLFGLMGLTLALAQEPNADQAGTKKESKAQPKAQTKSTKASTTAESSKNASKPQEPPLAPQEMSIAERVHVGHLPCELGATVRIEADPSQAGAFHVQGKGFKYRMFPVQTSTASPPLGGATNGISPVVWHGGEAEASRKLFVKLSKAEREDLIAFLNTR